MAFWACAQVMDLLWMRHWEEAARTKREKEERRSFLRCMRAANRNRKLQTAWTKSERKDEGIRVGKREARNKKDTQNKMELRLQIVQKKMSI